jgi:N-acylglucosamine 2-epimerase
MGIEGNITNEGRKEGATMEQPRIDQLRKQYQAALLDDIIPFWLKHGLDREYGGFLHCLDRDGSVFNTDKNIWINCRGGVWIFAKLYNEVEPRQEWLQAATSAMDFVMKYAFDWDGRMFFSVTRDGRPLRKRRYLFSEIFGVIACTEYFRATGDERYLQRARDTYRLMINYYRAPGALPPKIIPQTRRVKSHAMPMILVATTQELRKVDSDPLYTEVVDDALYQILNHFWREDEGILLENVGLDGERLDSPEGRLINPGHAIESAWFIMHEGRERQDASLIQAGLKILESSLEWGWDKEYGGILYFLDVKGKPPEQLEWDQKLWWPHSEALYATLLAYHLTGEGKYLDWFEKVHEWTFSHFPDPEYGEWFAYLHRDGSVLLPLKGGNWKGFFHVPRALLLCGKLLKGMSSA